MLVPRAAHQAGSLSESLRAYGAVPHEIATIAIRPPQDSTPLVRELARLREGAYAWLVFTSANTVDAVAAHGWDTRMQERVRVAAVGDRTAAALARLGTRVELLPSGEQSAEGLLRCWPPPDTAGSESTEVLLPRSDIARDTLERGLRRLGWRCRAVTAYRTVPADPPWRCTPSLPGRGHASWPRRSPGTRHGPAGPVPPARTRLLATESTSAPLLALLAEEGSTRRIRNIARIRNSARNRRPKPGTRHS